MSDAQLIAAARAGDRRAMAALYSEHAGRVYSVVRRMVGDDHLAEDVSQDAWVRAFEKLHLFRGDSSFGTWMHRLAVNTALNRLRRQGKRPDVEATAHRQPGPPPADETILNQRLLGRALDQLSPGYRMVLVMHDVEGLTHEEIAERTGVAVGTSKSQLHKARARMRDLLSPARQRDEAGNHA
ncbi:MAG: sigma-70 family RNA polymerase sigma factor [Candidatus Palauibacterales bacterium]|nr:sigma-70 family RNA polymerase sigma factor [Candidatus Palauibacterales bacterium]